MTSSPRNEPPTEAFDAALDYLLSHPQPQVVLTMVLKLHMKSKQKQAALLWAIQTVTTMTSRLLDHLREDPRTFNPRGAIVCVFQLMAEQQSKGKMPGSGSTRYLGGIIRKHHQHHADIGEFGHQLSATLRDGVYQRCALMILRWFDQSIRPLFTTESKHELDHEVELEEDEITYLPDLTTLTPEEIHGRWAIQYQRYHAAATVVMPFGRHRGKPLGDVGERELKWLQSRLLPASQLQPLLKAVETRLYRDPDQAAAYREAGRVAHPWRIKPRDQRAVRASQLDQKNLEPRKQHMLLAELSEQDLEQLHDELLEMQAFRRHYSKIEDAVRLLLESKFHRFPEVVPFPDTEQYQARERRHSQALKRFSSPFPARAKSPEHYTSADLDRLERQSRDEMLRAEGDLLPPKFQSLHFIRKIHPTTEGIDQRGYALLYDAATLRYTMIIDLYGRYMQTEPIVNELQNPSEPSLHFVTHPEQAYIFSKERPRLSFGIECGYDYQDQQFLRAAIGHGDEPLELRPTLGDAKVVASFNEDDECEFFAHVSVKIPLKPLHLRPTTILAFHQHDDGYSYALTRLDGIRYEVGDLVVPVHVHRKNNYIPYSRNYVYEVAHAMLNIAYKCLREGQVPLICIENTRWKKTATLSRTHNQQLFSQPIVEIITALTDKALLQGYMKPVLVGGVSPSRQCGGCHHLHPKGETSIIRATLIACPYCGSGGLEEAKEAKQVWCSACERAWHRQELIFHCAACGTSKLARYNTALAVAWQARMAVVSLWEKARRSR